MAKDKYEKIDEAIDPQEQGRQPGLEEKMDPEPIYDDKDYKGADKLKGKTALITGGDSGIGRAVAVAFAKEGANVAIAYLDEHDDAEETVKAVESYGGKCIKLATDISQVENCNQLIVDVIGEFGELNILVNNAGKQFPQDDFLNISQDQLRETFETNIFSMFYLTQAAIPHLQKGDSIINTSSVTAYRGSPSLIDYSATKGAITAFTRSLASNLIDSGIRVNSVAPGPIWTPLIPATFDAEKVGEHGGDTPMERRGQPAELAPAYVYLAAKDSSYVTGETIHVNGGDFISS
ncbi:SDR family oxidoreductase [Planococcus halotolerans]|uniref:NAD(P)-dependent oxidoreductase n=1 Tax=Planococcus halotolerans TaxID=2233542 RepID=A0A365L6D6_9BACL|nr:SDR family oxidoreductase [Planococcus halotolerans]QHJ70321.1 SDR family oxidoreductase [Planococcus halotolerans]RAZ80949.1 NAD(P)-dependent oxidoreductase [Planococcus halotolerans]